MSRSASERRQGRSALLGPTLNDATRRCLDVMGAGAGLLVLSPLFAVLAVLIRLDSGGPALFRAQRIGRDGSPFTLYKFRSMVVDAPLHGPAITADQDPRVTSVGRVLRRTKLDELPQLLNVFVGTMSLVGPRPEDPRYVALYSSEQREILRAKPGITSPASVKYRDEERQLSGQDWEQAYVHRIMPAKLAIDLDYLRRRTPWSDMGIILRTLCLPFSRHSEA
jgi:lipopolysaccharide/colanic/teichoic acid biosynthesis glycosyltransferase